MEQIQFGVIFDEDVSLKKLQKFPCVCLPNVAIISEDEANLFREYVRGGGKLLITGQTGQFDTLGRPMKRPIIEDLIGARINARLASDDNWISLDHSAAAHTQGSVLTADLPPDWPFLVKGPATIYEPKAAKGFGKLYKPHRTQRQREGRMSTDWPMSSDRPVGPAVLVNTFGKGKVVTCAGVARFCCSQ